MHGLVVLTLHNLDQLCNCIVFTCIHVVAAPVPEEFEESYVSEPDVASEEAEAEGQVADPQDPANLDPSSFPDQGKPRCITFT